MLMDQDIAKGLGDLGGPEAFGEAALELCSGISMVVMVNLGL